MDVALACLDKWARDDESDIKCGNECCYVYDGRNHVWQAMQMAEHALVHEIVLGIEVAIVVDVMCAVVAIESARAAIRFRMVVEGNGEHHWHVYQYQQPCEPCPSIVNPTHYPK